MPRPKTILPPQIGKWLASKNPALVQKAEAVSARETNGDAPQTPTWTPAETEEMPAQIQRLRRP